MADTPTPIVDEHIAFARELVALSRRHGASHLQVHFSLTGGRRLFEGQYNPTHVQFDWNEGRHGDRSSFSLRAEAVVQVEEEETPHADR